MEDILSTTIFFVLWVNFFHVFLAPSKQFPVNCLIILVFLTFCCIYMQ